MAAANDRLLGFMLPGRSARGRIVRLGPVLDSILSAHAYPAAIARLLAEALLLAAMTGDLLRPDDGQLTIQARGSGGPLTLLVADWRDGELRGYAQQDLDRRRAMPDGDMRPGLERLFGAGYLAITLEQTLVSERYQGIVALGETCLEESAEHYFNSSEQVPTLVRLAAAPGPDGRWLAGGFLVQQLSRAERDGPRLHVEAGGEDWAHVRALAATLKPDELLDPALSDEELLWRLFNEDEVRVLPARALSRGCRCNAAHIRTVLEQFPEDERADMRNADGVISVDCEFCSRQFLMRV